MLAHPTHERLIALGLAGRAKAFEEQRASPDLAALSFEERVGILADREAAERDTKRMSARLKFAALRQDACVEDIDLRTPRGLDRAPCQARCRRLDQPAPELSDHGADGRRQELVGLRLRPQGLSRRALGLLSSSPRLFEARALARGDGRHGRLLKTLGRVELLEILEDRNGRGSTIVTS